MATGPFPFNDPVGPGTAVPGFDAHHVGEVLVPTAATTDRHGLSRATLARLASAGLFGSPLTPAAAQRELAEVIAGCDASAWFSWVQHQSPLRALETAQQGVRTPGVDSMQATLLPDLRAGTQVAAVAFAHLRRPGRPNPEARRVVGGWVLNGTLDWVTSWDLADVVLVMARTGGADAGSIVSGFLPAGASSIETHGLQAGPVLSLMAMGGTHTRPLTLTDVLLPDDAVVSVQPADAWDAADRVTSANANPAAFGVTRGAIAELSTVAVERSDLLIAEVAACLAEECRAIRASAYRIIDGGDGSVEDRLALRAASLDLAARATSAVVVARAGAAMRQGHDAERRVREAMFLQVQAQTGATRAAAMELIRRRSLASRGTHAD